MASVRWPTGARPQTRAQPACQLIWHWGGAFSVVLRDLGVGGAKFALALAGTLTSGPPVIEIETDSDPIRRLKVTLQVIAAPGDRTPELQVSDCRAGGAESVTLVVTDELPIDTVMLGH